MILVTVLLFMATLLALIVYAQASAWITLRAESRRTDRAELHVAATEAAWAALRTLAADGQPWVDHTNEAWAEVVTNRLPNAVVTVAAVEDENRCFSVNNLRVMPTNPAVRAPAGIARDVLVLAQWPDPDGLAQCLKDWVDPDAEGVPGPGALRPPNGPFESPAELYAVLESAGSGRDPVSGAAAFTVLPERDGRIEPVNVNTAGRDVLLALLGPARGSLAEFIVKRRAVQPVVALDEVLDPAARRALDPYLAAYSRCFSVSATAERGSARAAVYGLVRRDERGQVEVLRWTVR